MSSMTGGFAAFSDDGTMTDCTSLSEDKVHIKCVYHSDIRTFTLQPLETFEEFARKIEVSKFSNYPIFSLFLNILIKRKSLGITNQQNIKMKRETS